MCLSVSMSVYCKQFCGLVHHAFDQAQLLIAGILRPVNVIVCVCERTRVDLQKRMLRLLNMHRPASPTAIKIFLLVGFEICRDCTILMRELPLSLHALNAVAVSHRETSFRRLNN